jgi:hypothetical protein
MRYVEVIETILAADARADWLPPRSGATPDAGSLETYIYLADVHLRLERDGRRIDPAAPDREWSGVLAPGSEWHVNCRLWYGTTCLDRITLVRRVELFPDFTNKERLFISPCVPVARVDPGSGTRTVSRFDYQIARILDWGDRVDGFLERWGYAVELHLTPDEHIARRRAAFQPPSEDVEPRTPSAGASQSVSDERRGRQGLFGRRS